MNLRRYVGCNNMSEEFEIRGYAEGLGRTKGMLGAFLFILPGGTTMAVSDGFSITQRRKFWKERSNFLGKKAEIQYQEKTPDGSLRFPVFLRIREDI